MKYRPFIEKYFLIDEPKEGKLVPFVFNPVQIKYYDELCALGLETKGIGLPLREIIVKARREGFSSLIIALFAADDILQENPTESQVVSYKDDATGTFRRRYRRFVLSYFAKKQGIELFSIQADSNVLERIAKSCFAVDSTDLVLRHNQAHFYCGSASARTGGRGGVLQKLLFSEAAHYMDTENMTAAESIEGTAQQVDKESGWIFQESTGNGKGNHFYKTYDQAMKGISRYKNRFYGWKDFYSQKQFDNLIKPEFTDPDMLKQEYPATVEEAFLSSTLSFTNEKELLGLVGIKADKRLALHLQMQGVNYIDQCETIKDFLLSFERSNPNRKIYAGLDSAKDVDRTVLTILISNELSTQGGIRGIAIDSTGQGDFVPDWFEKNSKWYIHRVKFSRPTKSILYKNLRVIIQDKLTALPDFKIDKGFISEEWENFFTEMIDLQKQIIGEMLVVAHPAGNYHDDFPDSWALAEFLFITLNGVPSGQRPPEEHGNFDSAVRRLLEKKGRAGTAKGIDNFN